MGLELAKVVVKVSGDASLLRSDLKKMESLVKTSTGKMAKSLNSLQMTGITRSASSGLAKTQAGLKGVEAQAEKTAKKVEWLRDAFSGKRLPNTSEGRYAAQMSAMYKAIERGKVTRAMRSPALDVDTPDPAKLKAWDAWYARNTAIAEMHEKIAAGKRARMEFPNAAKLGMTSPALDVDKTLSARFQKLWTTVKQGPAALTGVSTQAGVLNTKFANLKGTIKGLATGFGLVGGVVAFAQMIRSGEEFERKMRNSLAIMGADGQVFSDKMRAMAFEVAAVTRFSAAEVAESYYFLASAGLNAAQSLKAVGMVAQFAQAGNFDLAKATELLTNAQASLGMTVKDPIKNLENMTRVADVLNEANILATGSTEEFALALTRKAGAAGKIMKQDIEEVTAVLAAFAKQGTKGYLGGQAYNIVLRDLTTKAIINADAFKRMGVEVYGASGEMNSMADITRDLEKMISGLSDEETKLALKTLGLNDKSLIFTQTLVGMSKEIRDYEEHMRNAQGITQEIADMQLTKVQKAMARFHSASTLLGTQLNESLYPILANVTDALRGLFAMFGTWSGGAIKTALAIGAFSAAVFTVNKALAAYKGAATAAAAASIFLQGFTGPAGWAKLAAGVAAATFAVVAMNNTLEASATRIHRTSSAARELDAKLAGMAGTTEKTETGLWDVQQALDEVGKDLKYDSEAVNEFAKGFLNLNTILEGSVTRLQEMSPAMKKLHTDLASAVEESAKTGKPLELVLRERMLKEIEAANAESEKRRATAASKARDELARQDKETALQAKREELSSLEGLLEKEQRDLAARKKSFKDQSSYEGDFGSFDMTLGFIEQQIKNYEEKIAALKKEIAVQAPMSVIQPQVDLAQSILDQLEGIEAAYKEFRRLADDPNLAGGTIAQQATLAAATIDEMKPVTDQLRGALNMAGRTSEETALKVDLLKTAIEQGMEAQKKMIPVFETSKKKLDDLFEVFGGQQEFVKFFEQAKEEAITAEQVFDKAMEKIRAGREAARPEDRFIWDVKAEKAFEEMDQALGGPQRKIEDLRFETELLNEELTETEILMARFNREHANPFDKANFAAAIAENKRAREDETVRKFADDWKGPASATRDLVEAGKSLKESLRTPSEILTDKIKEWKDMLTGKDSVITEETYMRALMKEREGVVADIEGLKGKEGASGITGFSDLGRMIQESLLKTVEDKTVAKLDELKGVLETIDKSIKEAPKGGLSA